MKKRFLSALLVMALALTLLPATALAADVAYPVTGGNIYFDPATGTITGADYEVTAVQIPAQINGVAVTSIGDEAFTECYSLNSVTIPGSVKSIGSGAFVFTAIKELTIPEGVVSIGESAFYATGLTSVTFPASLTSIGASAFMSSALTSATFLNGNTEIGGGAFNFESFEYVDDEGNHGYGGNVPLEGLIIYAPAGGKVEQYCKDKGIPFQTLNGEPQPPVAGFTDVKPGDWYAEAVQYAVDNGLMNGVGNGQFNPNGTTTRGQLMTILARMSGANTTGSSPWYQKGMDWAKAQGISDGNNPGGDISREQLATMLYRLASEPETGEGLSAFPDNGQVSGYAVKALSWAVEQGIVTGKGGKLAPQGTATRAEAATMLMRYCEKMGK